jgi:hypothetical protein
MEQASSSGQAWRINDQLEIRRFTKVRAVPGPLYNVFSTLCAAVARLGQRSRSRSPSSGPSFSSCSTSVLF